MSGFLKLKKKAIESSVTDVSHDKDIGTIVIVAPHKHTYIHTHTHTILNSAIDGMCGQPRVPATLPPGK
jgi:hypothetical protein